MFRKGFLMAILGLASLAQTPDCLVRGTVVDGTTGATLPGVRVTLQSTDGTRFACTGQAGDFAFAGLPPGTYRLTARHFGDPTACSNESPIKDQKKWREIDDMELPVAGRVETRVAMWPMRDVWNERVQQGVVATSGRLARPYGPDLDTSRAENFDRIPTSESLLDSAISTVLNPALVRDLPLAGRDIHATLVLQPGVTADTATARGLGFSVVGQRASSSNFLVDGVEHNNLLLSGPLLALAPESIQEYRYSTNGFSAEFGRASGLVANVATRRGSNQTHGLVYFYGKDTRLNANEWQRNASGQSRPGLREAQTGAVLSGRIVRDSLFGSVAGDYLRFRSVQARDDYWLPNQSAITRASPLARRYLDGSGLPGYPGTDPLTPVKLSLEPRIGIDRWQLLPRLDWVSPGQASRLFVRTTIASFERPDLVWTSYENDRVPFHEHAADYLLAFTANVTPSLLFEARAAFQQHRYEMSRPRDPVPYFLNAGLVLLPGSQLSTAFRNRDRGVNAVTGITWLAGRHYFKIGADVARRRLDGWLRNRSSGGYTFENIAAFLADEADSAEVPIYCGGLRRTSCEARSPAFDRDYTITDAAGYAQTTLRLRDNWVLHAGFRVDSFGSPSRRSNNSDTVFVYDTPPTDNASVASIRTLPASDGRPFATSRDVAARLGSAVSFGARRHTIRVGYGAFHDRLSEGLWLGLRRNGVGLASYLFDDATSVYRALGSGRSLPPLRDSGVLLTPTAIAADFKPGLSHNAYVAFQPVFASRWSPELTGQLASGRRLPSSNLVNRQGSLTSTGVRFGEFPFRANQAESTYSAMTASIRYRGTQRQFQASYTWGHAIDHQSDALRGYFTTVFYNPRGQSNADPGRAAFTDPFRPDRDRGNADFGQRHNLVVYGSAAAPFLKDWQVAGLLAARSGFPYSVVVTATQRANLVGGNYAQRTQEGGGVRLLNRAAFAVPTAGQPGNTGRNAFPGPGVVNADLSLARRWKRITLRADAFNLLNHANLNRPVRAVRAADFGIAKVGRREEDTGLPSLTPLAETPRQIQVLLRYEF